MMIPVRHLAPALVALLLATTAKVAAEPDPAVAVVVAPVPQPRPHGLKGLFQRLSRRDREVVVVAPEPVEGAIAPIDLVPPEAEAEPVETPASRASEVASPTPFVNTKVSSDQVPTPNPNPRRAVAVVPSDDAAQGSTAGAVRGPVEAEAVPVGSDAIAAISEAASPAVADVAEASDTIAPPLVEAADASEAADLADVTPPMPLEGEAATAEPSLSPATDTAPEVRVIEALPPEPDPQPEADKAEAAVAVTEPVPASTDGEHATPEPVIADAETPAPESPPAAEPAPAEETAAAASLGGEAVETELTLDQRMEAEKLVAAAQGDVSPRELVDILQDVQDRIAQGSVAALSAQRRLRARIDQVFAEADPSVWQDPANALAAVIYVLSGGSPDVLRGFAMLDPEPAIDPRLPKGALAYVEGRQGEAAGLLMKIDVEELPARIGGQVALAQAALSVGTEPQQALAYLDKARLISPGTLVEEGALRRSLFIADQLRDEDRFESLSRQYLGRFRNSIYAGNFRYRFAAGLTHLRLMSDPAEFPRLEALLAELEPEARAGLYLTVAGAAVVEGKLPSAALAAARADELSLPGTPERARARLYAAAALVGDAGTFDAAVANMKTVQETLLGPADKALRNAVGDTIAAIEAGADPATLSDVTEDPNAPVEEHPLVTRGKALRDEIDLVLAGAS